MFAQFSSQLQILIVVLGATVLLIEKQDSESRCQFSVLPVIHGHHQVCMEPHGEGRVTGRYRRRQRKLPKSGGSLLVIWHRQL